MGLSLRIRAPLRFARRYLANPEKLVAPRRRPGAPLPPLLVSALLQAERPALVQRLFRLMLARARAKQIAALIAPQALRWSGRLLIATGLRLFTRLYHRRFLRTQPSSGPGRGWLRALRATSLLRYLRMRARTALRRALARSGWIDKRLTAPLRHRLVVKHGRAGFAGPSRGARRPRSGPYSSSSKKIKRGPDATRRRASRSHRKGSGAVLLSKRARAAPTGLRAPILPLARSNPRPRKQARSSVCITSLPLKSAHRLRLLLSALQPVRLRLFRRARGGRRQARPLLRDVFRRNGKRQALSPLAPSAIFSLSQLPRSVGLARRLSFRNWFRVHLYRLRWQQKIPARALRINSPSFQAFAYPVLSCSSTLGRFVRQRQLNARLLRQRLRTPQKAARKDLRTSALRASSRILLTLRILLTRSWALPRVLVRQPMLWHGLPVLLSPPLRNALSHTALLTPGKPAYLRAPGLRARSPRTLRFFFARLRQRYGFKRRQPPFRLDSSAGSNRGGKGRATERLELYRLLKVVRRFYGHLTRAQLWRARRTAVRRRQGTAAFRALLLFESRLDTLLLRARLCSSLAEAKQLIRAGWICVNGRAVLSYRFVVELRDAVTIHPQQRLWFRRRLLTRWSWAVRNPGPVLERIFPFYLEFNPRALALAYVPSLTNLFRSPTALRFSKSLLANWGRFAY